ncbi:MAG: hypothetical protein AAF563_07470 [Pseudomonadota bacterium]
MTASQISRLALAVSLCLLWPTGAVWAQSDSNEPLFIIPGFDQESTGQGAPETTVAPEVEIEALTAPSGGGAGTLDAETGGLPSDMWRDADPAIAQALLPNIPTATDSAAMNRLAGRLLLSAAEPPRAIDPAEFLGYRVDRLVALGRGEDAEALLSSAGNLTREPAVMGPRINQMLLEGDVAGACPLIREILRADDGVYWQEAMIFCQRIDGQDGQADLGLSLLRDQGADISPLFLRLDRAVRGEPGATLDSLADVNPLLLAMALQADVAILPAAVSDGEPAVLAALAQDQDLTLDTRLPAAEIAVAQAVLDPAELGAIYDQVTFTDVERANALSTAQKIGGPKGRALLYQAGQTQPSETARAEVYRALLANALADGGIVSYAAIARVIAPEVSTLRLTPELSWFAGDAVAALLVAGDPEAAARWWPLLEDRARSDGTALAESQSLWPLMRMAFGEQLPDDGERMKVWWEQIAADTESDPRARGEIYASLLTGLDDEAVDPLLPELLLGPQESREAVQKTVLIDAMIRSASTQQVGQTVLVALVVLGDGGPSGADAVTLGAVVSALREVGLGQDARLIALEAAFANGA